MSNKIDSDKAPEKKSGIRGFFNFVAKAALWTFPLMVGASLLFDPTWLLIFHNESNLVAQAWIHKMTPFTDWLPHHLGFKGEDGVLYDFMNWFLEDEITALETAKDGLVSNIANSSYTSNLAAPTAGMFGP